MFEVGDHVKRKDAPFHHGWIDRLYQFQDLIIAEVVFQVDPTQNWLCSDMDLVGRGDNDPYPRPEKVRGLK